MLTKPSLSLSNVLKTGGHIICNMLTTLHPNCCWFFVNLICFVLPNMIHLSSCILVYSIKVPLANVFFFFLYRSSNRQNTSIHDHVVGHPKDVVQYAPELPSVQAVSCSSRDGRLPKKHVKLSDEALNLCFIDWGRWNSSYISCMIFTFYVLAW